MHGGPVRCRGGDRLRLVPRGLLLHRLRRRRLHELPGRSIRRCDGIRLGLPHLRGGHLLRGGRCNLRQLRRGLLLGRALGDLRQLRGRHFRRGGGSHVHHLRRRHLLFGHRGGVCRLLGRSVFGVGLELLHPVRRGHLRRGERADVHQLRGLHLLRQLRLEHLHDVRQRQGLGPRVCRLLLKTPPKPPPTASRSHGASKHTYARTLNPGISGL